MPQRIYLLWHKKSNEYYNFAGHFTLNVLCEISQSTIFIRLFLMKNKKKQTRNEKSSAKTILAWTQQCHFSARRLDLVLFFACRLFIYFLFFFIQAILWSNALKPFNC